MKRHRGNYKQAPRKDAWKLAHVVPVMVKGRMSLKTFMQKKLVVVNVSTGEVTHVKPEDFFQHPEKYGLPIGVAMEESKLTLLRKHTKRVAKNET